MILKLNIDGHEIETEIGDGIVKMSHMSPKDLARFLRLELFTKTWPTKLDELLQKRIVEIRDAEDQ